MKTVLVVDDEFEIREMLHDFLSLKGFKVMLASNGEEGLNLFKENSIDAVIMDLRMPKMDGIQCSREIKKIDPEFPIIIITGHLNEDYKRDLKSISIKALLDKPLDIHRLGQLLQHI